jgi:hypothetical protein
MFIRLTKPDGMFHDPQTGLRIIKSQVVEVQQMGALTQSWMNGGGLVCCDAEVEPKTKADSRGKTNSPSIIENPSEAPEAAPSDDAGTSDSQVSSKKKSKKG